MTQATLDARRSGTTSKATRVLLVALVVLNLVVLLGQLWPEGAPPFARFVNVAFLVATLGVFGRALFRR
jgi:hypothetical protein